VRSLIAERGEFPATSQVGAQAIREFDGQTEADTLVTELCAFDAFVERLSGAR
jgi:hypothetical protein